MNKKLNTQIQVSNEKNSEQDELIKQTKTALSNNSILIRDNKDVIAKLHAAPIGNGYSLDISFTLAHISMTPEGLPFSISGQHKSD